jgi:hypothetical protein
MSSLSRRPPEAQGALDPRLPDVHEAVARGLGKVMRGLKRPTLKLPRPEFRELAGMLVEFMEDLHCGIGLWAGLERENRDLFGTPLPLFLAPPADGRQEPALAQRIRHLLYVIYPAFVEGLRLSPDHADLARLADGAADLLRESFHDLPRESGVKAFLGTPNRRAWDAKRKLVWLGTESYLFRRFFLAYSGAACGEGERIDVMDDFVCQECSEWSGLTAADLLAATLDLPEARKAELRSWHERHQAFYRVIEAGPETLKAENLINGETYVVRVNMPGMPFSKGVVVFGGLVPWDGEWYWSGLQRKFGRLPETEVKRLRADFLRKSGTIVYRYARDRLARAREILRGQREDFLRRHGGDLKVYADGLSMAADWQASFREKFESLPEAERKRIMERHGLKRPRPSLSLPDQLLQAKGGLGVFFDPEEGDEVMEGFDLVLSGMAKKGEGLTQDEARVIWHLMLDDSISPAFVRRIVRDHGDESIRGVFLLSGRSEPYVLDYLLRRYKGHFYKNRYPAITIAD